jgi:hypothetical protein
MRFLSSRTSFFTLAVLVHLLAFWLLSRIHFTDSEVVPEETTPQFTLIKLPPPATPPQLPEEISGSISMPSPVVALPSIATANPIVTEQSASFDLPKVQMPSMGDHLPVNNSLISGAGNGDGAGAKGDGLGHDGSGDGNGLAGIGRDEHLIAVTDISSSMKAVAQKIWTQLSGNYPHASIIKSESALGKFMEGYSQRSGTGTNAGDLYEGVYQGLKDHPDATAIYILTDFEDGANTVATDAMIAFLRSKHIKLYVCSVEQPPYDHLIQYAQESGGGHLQMTKEAITSFKP